MYSEDREVDEGFLKKHNELLKKQGEFEVEQKLLEKSKDYLEKKENIKIKIMNWLVVAVTFLFLIFLGLLLL